MTVFVSFSVCKAVVDEVEYSISQVDPNKKIQLGSYRIDPNGKTRTVQVVITFIGSGRNYHHNNSLIISFFKTNGGG